MINSEVKVVLIVPCFNEELRWDFEYWKRVSAIQGLSIVFVDDGSADQTLVCIRKTCEAHSNFSYIHLPSNSGKAEAIRNGLLSENASGADFLGFLDADGAFDFIDIEELLLLAVSPEMRDYDAVWTSRVKLSGRVIVRSQMRHYVSRILMTVIYSVLNLNFYDTQSGFKMFRAPIILPLINEKFQTRWFIDVEIVLRHRTYAASEIVVWEEPLKSWREVPGSKINLLAFFSILKDILVLVRQRKVG